VTHARDIADVCAAEARAAQRRVIEAADASRAQIARELHDGVQQQLVNTLLFLRRAEDRWTTAPDEARDLVALAVDEARNGIDGLRELAAGVHPAILTTRGLAAALEALAARLPYRLELDLTPICLPAAVEASIYFFCCEALEYVTRNAQAETARVRTVVADGYLTIELYDDGVGGAHAHPGASLSGPGDRMAALEGTLEVVDPPTGGTTLTACLPLPS
jgi:signal transduction histidine kinase